MTAPYKTVISVDAMGGDDGPKTVVKGLSKISKKYPEVKFILHGPKRKLKPLLVKHPLLAKSVSIRHAENVILMDDQPAMAVRKRKGTSMFNTIEAVRNGDANTAVSCGNTGALMAISAITLKRLPAVKRPAIAVFWPSLNPQSYNVILDVGADIRADAHDLCVFASMGAAYARNAFQLDLPRVGLLNIGTEEHKGTQEVKLAAELLQKEAYHDRFEYIGFVEGGDIASSDVDVIVTDGLAGNIALKTAEGTAKAIGDMLKASFSYSPLSRLASLFAFTSLARLKRRIDPRRANGGVFLGLNGTVVKSHGGADSTGVAAALDLAIRLDQKKFNQHVSDELAALADKPDQKAG